MYTLVYLSPCTGGALFLMESLLLLLKQPVHLPTFLINKLDLSRDMFLPCEFSVKGEPQIFIETGGELSS